MKRLIRYNFFGFRLESIQHKLSSDYSLNIYFSRRFPYIDGISFSPYKPVQNVDFSKVGNAGFFTHILTRTQGKKFQDMFLVKIASKGTSLIIILAKLKSFIENIVQTYLTLSGPGGGVRGPDDPTQSCQSETSYPMMPKLLTKF